VWSVSTREVDLAHKPEPRHLSYNPALNVHTQKQRALPLSPAPNGYNSRVAGLV